MKRLALAVITALLLAGATAASEPRHHHGPPVMRVPEIQEHPEAHVRPHPHGIRGERFSRGVHLPLQLLEEAREICEVRFGGVWDEEALRCRFNVEAEMEAAAAEACRGIGGEWSSGERVCYVNAANRLDPAEVCRNLGGEWRDGRCGL